MADTRTYEHCGRLTSGVAGICCEEGQSWKIGHGAPTANFRAGCSRCSLTTGNRLWLMQYWPKELWVVDICTSWSRDRRLHNIRIVSCQIYSKVNQKWNCWKSRGATCRSAPQLATPLRLTTQRAHFTSSCSRAPYNQLSAVSPVTPITDCFARKMWLVLQTLLPSWPQKTCGP